MSSCSGWPVPWAAGRSLAVTVKTKAKCQTCGTSNRSGTRFCKECGTALEII